MHRDDVRSTETQDGKKAAEWQLARGSVLIRKFQIRDAAFPAYRYPDKPMPSAQPGTVYFDHAQPPDLVQARDWFPKHEDLWNAIQKELWPALLNSDNLPITPT